MLQVSTWTRLIVGLILLAGLLIAVPNALPDNIRAGFPRWLPSQTVTLGLDLQGGSYLLLEVELEAVQKDKLESLMSDARRALRKAHILYDNIGITADTFSVEIKDPAQRDEARTLIQGLNPNMGSGVLGVSGHAYEFSDNGRGTFTMKITEQYKSQTQAEIVNQSIEVVRRRIDEMGTREPTIERQGEDRILVQVPGLKDPEHLKRTLGKTAKMTFQLVDEAADRGGAAQRGVAPIGDEILPVQNKDPKAIPQMIVVENRVMVAGDRLVDASAGFDSRTGEPTVNFRFDSVGAREFGDVTKSFPGGTQRFAIVLAKKVIEERTVGAELGADSVKAGRYSALAGLLLVALFMIARYGLFGLFADIALTLNVILLLAILTLFGATLTLPGIAGIVLTMGMAVDANVLIYERIREEQRNGRSMLASIDQGFRRAMSTIIDANSTHVIAALILFQLGSGPVRGFAVTLGVGIITSFFTAVMVTRLIVILWLQMAKPKRLAI